MSKPLPELVCFCPLLGVKRTKSKQGVMSAYDPKRTKTGLNPAVQRAPRRHFRVLPLPVGFRVGQRVRITVNPADKGALRLCTSDATVAFTGPGPSSPLPGIGGMSPSPAGSSKRGDYP
jgi:hypothetical protein